MSYEIVKSIVIKKDRVFSRMDSNNVYPLKPPSTKETYNPISPFSL